MRLLRRDAARSPDRDVSDGPPVGHVAILGADLHGLRPSLIVAEGDLVCAGEALLTDRRHPEVAIVAPISGTVESIQRGPRRSISALVIRRGTADPAEVPSGEVRGTLLSRGMWPAFRTRPFGHIPAPDAVPEAIFVTATRADPAAPDPAAVLEVAGDDFRGGLEALSALTEGRVHVCQAPGPDLVPSSGRIEVARMTAGLASAHVHRLCPVRRGREVWTIGYQDVVATGHLMRTGRYMAERVVSIATPERARMVRTVLGASLRDLTAGMRAESVMSGPAAGGREAAFLGRYHLQVTLGARPREEAHPLRPIIPLAALDGALPIPTLAVPLMRALSIGDVETAERLGCLGLVEEDMAELTRLCTSGADYGRLLRRALDELAAA